MKVDRHPFAHAGRRWWVVVEGRHVAIREVLIDGVYAYAVGDLTATGVVITHWWSIEYDIGPRTVMLTCPEVTGLAHAAGQAIGAGGGERAPEVPERHGIVGRTTSIVGREYGWLKVVGLAFRTVRCRIWKCLCRCGRHVDVQTSRLTAGRTRSCGCWARQARIKNAVSARASFKQSHRPYPIRFDLTGRVFGRLTVERPDERRKDRGRGIWWVCRCECGNRKNVKAKYLTGGSTASCGCLRLACMKRGSAGLITAMHERQAAMQPVRDVAERWFADGRCRLADGMMVGLGAAAKELGVAATTVRTWYRAWEKRQPMRRAA